MKMIRILFMFALVFSMSNAFGQIKVASSGQTVVGGDGVAGVANLESKTSASAIEFALNSGAGNPDFTFQELGNSRGQFKYVLGRQGVEIQVSANNVGNGGLQGSTTTAMHLNTNLNVGVGTTAPSEKLHVAGNVLATGMFITSDVRLKEDASSFNRGLAEIMKMKTYSYEYTGQAGIKSSGKQYGVMAQDLQKIAPELVSSYTHKIWEDAADGESETLVGTEEYLKINATAIQWMLVNAVQEQQAKIAELEAKLAELTDKK